MITSRRDNSVKHKLRGKRQSGLLSYTWNVRWVQQSQLDGEGLPRWRFLEHATEDAHEANQKQDG